MHKLVKDTVQIVGGALLVSMVLIAVIFLVGRYVGKNEPQAPSLPTIPAAQWQPLTEGELLWGPADAPVKIVEFFDYQCTFCKRLHDVLEALHTDFPEKVSLVVRHFPLSSHPQAFPAAVAAECARQQGRFSHFHRTLFYYQFLVEDAAWERLAELAKVPDLTRFSTCLSEEEPVEKVTQDRQYGEALGLGGTPTLIINGRVHVGMMSQEQLERLVTKAIAEAK